MHPHAAETDVGNSAHYREDVRRAITPNNIR
jgi:hypothetical protein